MPLIDLKTNLKDLKFGNDEYNGGNSGQPFIQTRIPNTDESLQTNVVANANLKGDRKLTLEYKPFNGAKLDKNSRDKVLGYIEYLWGYSVDMVSIDSEQQKLFD